MTAGVPTGWKRSSCHLQVRCVGPAWLRHSYLRLMILTWDMR